MLQTDWLIEWGLTPFLTISQLYHVGQFTYSCISWFSHTSTPHNNLYKQLAAFPHRLSPLVENEWRMSHWLLSIVGKKVGRAGIQTHNPWIDSPRRYRAQHASDWWNRVILWSHSVKPIGDLYKVFEKNKAFHIHMLIKTH